MNDTALQRSWQAIARAGAERALPLRSSRATAVPQVSVIPVWEKAFAVLGLFLCLDAGVRTIRILSGIEGPIQNVLTEANYAEGSPLTQILLFSVYIVSIALLVIHPSRQLLHALRPRLLWLLPLYALVSIAWSGAAAISFRRTVALVGTSVFGLYLASRYSRATLLHLLLVVAVMTSVLSLLISVALPAYAIDDTGAWQGVFGQKNQLGQFMALSAMLWLIAAVRFRRYLLPGIFGALAIVLLVLSRSATAIVIFTTLIATLMLARLLRVRFRLALPIIVLLLALGGYFAVRAASDPTAVLGLLGRDSSLTGRTQLWGLVWHMIQERPWFGYGYGGFWLGFDGPSAPVWLATGWNPPSAHNGLLDLLLDLGFVGLLILVPIVITVFHHAIALARRGRVLDTAFPLIFLVFYLVSNTTESFLVAYNTLSWVLFVTITLQLSLWWEAERRSRPQVTRCIRRKTPRTVPVASPEERSALQEGSRMASQTTVFADPMYHIERHGGIAAQEGTAMLGEITVSAIMPTYNAMPYLKHAIDSVLAQTFTDWELIIVDDGSTDGTQQLLARYTDPRIRVFQLDENGGRGKARNVAVGFACGKYIAPCDADDVSLPQRFATEVAYLESHPEVHVVSSQMKDFHNDEPPQSLFLYPEEPKAIDRRFAKGKMGAPFGAAMIRSWVFDRFGLFNEDLRTSEDFEWFLRIRRGCNFRVLPEALYLYRHDAKRATLKQWIKNGRYARYARYRARIFGTRAESTALPFSRFSRRWGTLLALHTWDVLRYINYRLRSKMGSSKLM